MRLLHASILVAVSAPFAIAMRAVLGGRVQLLVDTAANPLLLMGIGVAWVSTLVLLREYLKGAPHS